MKSGIVGKIVSWIASSAGSLCLLCLGVIGFLVLQTILDPTNQTSGWMAFSLFFVSALLGAVSLLFGLLGMYLTSRSSRSAWFGVVVGLFTAGVLGVLYLFVVGSFHYTNWMHGG